VRKRKVPRKCASGGGQYNRPYLNIFLKHYFLKYKQ
jgi:hypothetical protein